MNEIVKILMERDNISQEEAEDLLLEAKADAQDVLENDGSFEDIETILWDYFDLEPDFIFDLIDL